MTNDHSLLFSLTLLLSTLLLLNGPVESRILATRKVNSLPIYNSKVFARIKQNIASNPVFDRNEFDLLKKTKKSRTNSVTFLFV